MNEETARNEGIAHNTQTESNEESNRIEQILQEIQKLDSRLSELQMEMKQIEKQTVQIGKRTATLRVRFKNRISAMAQKPSVLGHALKKALSGYSAGKKTLYCLAFSTKPIKHNKIVFDNYMGKGYGGNPKYIAEKILEKYPGQFDLVWLVTKGQKDVSRFPAGIRTVEYQSLQAYREYLTAGVWVSNYHKISYLVNGLRKRKGQYFIQTWHGSLGIKKIENDVPALTRDNKWTKFAKMSSGMVDMWISNSRWETQIYRRAFWCVKNVIEIGHPRNDVLFGKGPDLARKAVKAYFHLNHKKILFYAPTFREDYSLDCYDIGFEQVRNALKDRFGGEWVILLRLHPRVQKYSPQVMPQVDYVKNATQYVDIQELIAAADAMITDYSSCIFDFLLTRRPGFIFAKDIETYDAQRGFYYPLEQTPFSIARTPEELAEQIRGFDDAGYKHAVEAFLEEKGCVEDGHAGERVAELINSVITGKANPS